MTHAADAPDPDEAITFERPIYFLDADPGERLVVPLIIKNSTSVVPTFTAQALDMRSGEGTGSTAFEYVPPGEAPRGAGRWLLPIEPAEITIPPRAQRELEVVIQVPDDAGAGGHFAAIMFSAPDPREDSQVRIGLDQPVAFFITVSGDYERDLRVTVDPRDRWRWTAGTATWDVELHNDGDVHAAVAGRVRLDGVIGGTRSTLLEPVLLFPGESRTQQVRFELRNAPDLLTATARVVLDDAPVQQQDARRVVVLPWWVLALVAAAVLVVMIRMRMRRAG